MKREYLLFWSFFVFFFILFIFQWGNYLIQNGYIRQVSEAFTSLNPIIDNGGPSTNHTVDLPLTNPISCKNMCGPNNRCSLTGEQCSSDIDCFGCNPHTKQFTPENSEMIRGQNDAGKLTTEQTPTYSVLTTDIGSRAKLIASRETPPPDYFKGVNTWKQTFDEGAELFDKRYSPSAQSFMPSYPKRLSLSGEFEDNGPLAANDFL
uniref:Uncharacterized protein n=1 Tax=viral metagenome TaxID=1070528 RepID=A0A6C0B2A5_9ZZZZ